MPSGKVCVDFFEVTAWVLIYLVRLAMFADSYFGGSSEVRGSAKACFKYVHPRRKDSTAATEGPALLRNPHVQVYLDEQGQKIKGKPAETGL